MNNCSDYCINGGKKNRVAGRFLLRFCYVFEGHVAKFLKTVAKLLDGTRAENGTLSCFQFVTIFILNLAVPHLLQI